MTLTSSEIQVDGYERIVEFTDDDFHAFIAVHSTSRGPALGGCRVKPYASREEALDDALRLSKAMTLKSALADLNLGGGKCIVLAEKATRDIMLKIGEAVNYFSGNYITAEDIGTTMADMVTIAEVTPHVVHIDGSHNTARGVFSCIKDAVRYLPLNRYGNLKDIRFWIQGLGKVGHNLLKFLAEHNDGHSENIYVSDIRPEIVQKAISNYNVKEYTDSLDAFAIDVYVPCAVGHIVNEDNVKTSCYEIICGSANNQLAKDYYASILRGHGVLYVPDFLANAGGVITAFGEIEHWDAEKIRNRCDNLGLELLQVLEIANTKNVSPLEAALDLVGI